MERKLCIYNPTANTNRVIALNQQIGCVVPYLEDVLLLAMENGFYSINVNTEKLTHIFDPEQHFNRKSF
ncbi:SMP-30/gluconolactonase/LRE family protein [Bacillus cereus]